MIKTLKKLLGKEYLPLNKIEISSKNLISNWRYLSSINKKIKIAPVLKSNAYGHGIMQVAKILDDVGAPFFCVDSIYEAYQILKAKLKTEILVMGYIDPQNLSVKKLPFSYSVYDIRLLSAINKFQKGANIHIKIDTGMHRLGVDVSDLPEFLTESVKFKNINICGLMSHIASPFDKKQTRLQIKNFEKALEIVKSFGINPMWKHIFSSTSLNYLDGKTSNLARVGISLYGIGDGFRLKPVLQLSSKIVQIKKIKKGDMVGYDGTFRAPGDMVIGLLPLGYNDGFDRRLSSLGSVILDEKICPIVGRVSMNICAIDLSGVDLPAVGQKVIIYSRKVSDINTILKSANLCQTIPHDLLVHLHPSIRREVVCFESFTKVYGCGLI